MMDADTYRTIQSKAHGDYRERGSKFLSTVFPCESEEDIKRAITELKKDHPTARHFCFAAVIGISEQEHRSSDDGEPSGSAGLPILNQILSAEVTNVGIVVVRYFGGTKLGKAGLIRAYKESARLSINAAKTVVRAITENVLVAFTYDDMGAVLRAIEQFPYAEIVNQTLETSCEIIFKVRKSTLDNALHLFDHLPNVETKPHST